MIIKTTLQKYLAFFNTPLLLVGQTVGQVIVQIQNNYAQNDSTQHLLAYYDAVTDQIVLDWNDQHEVLKRRTT